MSVSEKCHKADHDTRLIKLFTQFILCGSCGLFLIGSYFLIAWQIVHDSSCSPHEYIIKTFCILLYLTSMNIQLTLLLHFMPFSCEVPYKLRITEAMPVAKAPEHIVNTSIAFLCIALYNRKLTLVFGTKLA